MDNAPALTQDPRRVRLGRGTEAIVGGNGRPLLLLHGWGLRPHVFMPSLRRLAGRGFAVAAPSLAVVGPSWELERAVERALHVMNALEWDEAIVVGYSLGGAIATGIAAAHPERVRLLALVNSVGLRIDRGALGWALPVTRYARTGNLKALRAFGRNALHINGLTNLAGAARFARDATLARELGRVREHGVPSVVLWGSEDRLLPPDMGRAVADTLDAPIHLVPNADHDWPVLRPDLFAREVDLLLRGALADEPKRVRRRRPKRA